VLQKGVRWVTQYQRLTKVTKGVSAKYMRQFFISVAIPRMMYVADLFLVPGSGIGKGTRGFISKLAKIQQQAVLHITGVLRSAPTDAIDACADMLPFHLLVKKLTYSAATRLVTFPQSHPLGRHMAQEARRYVKSHRALVHEIMHAFKLNPADFESIKPCTGGIKDDCNFTIHISGSKEEAKQAAEADQSEVVVCSDGSGHEGGIGAVAVLYRGGTERQMLKKYLGGEDRHTVFEAELLSLSLAAEMLKDEGQVQSVMIGVDSQAAQRATGQGRANPGQYLVEAFHKQVAEVWRKHPGIEVTLMWMPGHGGIEGNERADGEAKQAAEGQSSIRDSLLLVCRDEMPCS